MSDYVRVKDKDTGHELSVLASEAEHSGYEKLQKKATYSNGVPLPPKHNTKRATGDSGQKAPEKKEG